jgi:peptide/nickel transport system permease protein
MQNENKQPIAPIIVEEKLPVEKVPSTLLTIWREIKHSKVSLVALILFVLIIISAFIISANIDTTQTQRINLRTLHRAPEWFGGEFVLGTDPGGRDMVGQILLGARTSFQIALIVTAIAITWGVLYGLIAGFFGGNVEMVMMRISDFIIMLPTTMIIITIVSIIPNYTTAHFIAILAFFAWTGRARLIRSKTLQQKNLDYVAASKTLGTPNIVIIFREVLPNITSIIVTNSILALAANMGMETGLTILGYGLPIGTPSLGRLISYAMDPVVLTARSWQWLPASILIFVLILCIYLVGNAVSRAVDPKQQHQR